MPIQLRVRAKRGIGEEDRELLVIVNQTKVTIKKRS